MTIEAARLAVYVGADTADAERKLDSFGSKISGMAGSAAKYGAVMSAGFTAPLVMLGKTAIDTAADFESQMNIMSVAAGDASVSLEDLRQAALNVGADTQLVGVSASEAADAMTNFYKAGLSTNEIFGDMQGYLDGTADLSGALRSAVDLQAASELDLAAASDLTTIAMSTFGIEAENATDIADSFVRAADASVTNVTELGAAMANVGPTMAAYGYGLDETNTALAVLSSRGIRGAEAGTALKSMFTNMMRQTDEVTDTWNELGVSMYDADGVMRSMPDIIGDLEKALNGVSTRTVEVGGRTAEQNTQLKTAKSAYDSATKAIYEHETGIKSLTGDALTKQIDKQAAARKEMERLQAITGTLTTVTSSYTDKQKNQIIQTLAGTYGMKALNTLLAEGAGGWADMEAAISSASSAEETAAALTQGYAAAMEQLKGSIETLLIEVATPFLQNFVTPFIRYVTDIIGKIGDLDPKIINIGLAIAGVLAVAGPLMLAFSGLVTVIGALASPIGIIVLAMAGLAAAWATDFGGIREKTQAVIDFVAPYFEMLRAWLADTIPLAMVRLQEAFTGLKSLFGGIQELWSAFSGEGGIAGLSSILGVTLAIEKIGIALGFTREKSREFGQEFATSLATAFSTISQALESIRIAVLTLQGAFEALMRGDLENMSEYLYELGMSFEQWQSVTGIIDSVKEAWAALVEFFEPTIQRLKDAVGPMLESFEPLAGKFDELKEAAGKLITALEPVIAIVGGALVVAFNFLLEIVAAVMPDLGTIIGNFVDIATTVLNTLAGVLEGLVEMVKALLEGDWAGAWEAASGIVDTLAEGIVSIVTNLFENIDIIVRDLVTAVVNWFGNMGIDVPAKLAELKASVIAKWAEITNVFSMTNLRMVGVNLIKGLADGIADTARNYLREKIESVSDWIPKWIKDRLGIHSPSRVFYEIGLNIIDGMIQGIEGRTPEAIEAMAGVLSGIAAIFEGMAGALNMPTIDDVAGRIRAINEQLKIIVFTFNEFAAWSFNYGNVLPALADVASNVGSVVSALKNTIETLAAMADLTLVDDLAGRMTYIIDAMRRAVEAVASFKSDSTLQEAASQAGALSVVAEAIAGMAKAWEIVGAFKSSDLDVSAVVTFLTDFAVLATGKINEALARLPAVAENWTTGTAAMSTALAAIGNMAKAWETLQGFKWDSSLDMGAVVTWLTGLAEMVTRVMGEAAGRGASNVGEGFAAWAAGVGEALGTIVDVAGAWETLQEFKWDSSLNMGEVTTWLSLLGEMVTRVMEETRSRGTSNVGEGFEDWADGVSTALGTIVDVAGAWEKLQGFKWETSFNVGAIVTWLAGLGAITTAALEEIRKKGWSNVGEGFDAWADGVTTAIAAIADIASAWETIREFKGKIGGAESGFDVQAVVNWLASFGAMAAEAMKIAQNNSNRTFGDMFDKFVSAVTSSVSALSGVIDFIGKLDAFKQGKDLPAKFQRLRYDFEDVLTELDKMRIAVQSYVTDDLIKFAQDVGLLADGLTSAVRLLAELGALTMTGDVTVAMSRLGTMIKAALTELGTQIGNITEETSGLIVLFGTAMGSLMTGLKSALDLALALPDSWQRPNPQMWASFMTWTIEVFEEFRRYVAANFPANETGGNDELGIISLFGGALSSLMGGLKTALELAIAVPATWGRPNAVMWASFMTWTMEVFEEFRRYVKSNFPADDEGGNDELGIISLFGSALGSLMGGLKTALELAIAVPKEWKRPDATTWKTFEGWVMDVFDTFAIWIGENFSGPDSDAQAALVTAVTGAMGSLFQALGNALSLAMAMPPDWSPPTNTGAFETFVKDMFTRFYSWINSTGTYEGKAIPFGTEGLKLVTEFGNAMGALFGGMAAALDVFAKLPGFITPAETQMNAFLTGVKRVMTDSANYVKTNISSETMKLVTEFGNSMQALFSGMQSALQVFDTMYKAGTGFSNWLAGAALTNSPFQRAMGDLFNAITLTMQQFRTNVVNGFVGTWQPAATTFLGAAQQIFALLDSALRVFTGIKSSGLPSLDELRAFVDAVIAVVRQMTINLMAEVNNAPVIGQNYGQGIADGLHSKSIVIGAAGYQVGTLLLNATKAALGIASPSQMAIEMGQLFGTGLVVGMDSTTASVERAAMGLASAMGMPQLNYSSIGDPVYTVRIEGDISVGGVPIDPATANEIARLVVQRVKLHA